ncbi:MAG: sporulation/spore germination protein [Hormoscilla sp.]
MNIKNILAFLLLVGTIIVSHGRFRPDDSNTPAIANSLSTNRVADQVTTTSSRSPIASTDTANNTVTVTIYKADSQCETLIPENLVFPQHRLLVRVVGKVIEQATSADFDIAGYRVNLDRQRQVATVDLRLNPNTRRKLVSLSFCEQFALFGSLRQTLTDNQNWQIKEVRFTQLGQEIIF